MWSAKLPSYRSLTNLNYPQPCRESQFTSSRYGVFRSWRSCYQLLDCVVCAHYQLNHIQVILLYYTYLRNSSVLRYNSDCSMVGALNKLPVAASGLIFFGDPVTFSSVTGIFTGFVAGLVYALAKQTQSKTSRPIRVMYTAVALLTIYFRI
jgi:hypothetical protein